MRRPRPFFGPIKLPAATWNKLFEELEPIRHSDGRLLKRYRLKGTDLVGQEEPMDELFEIGKVEPKPMVLPTGGIFYMDTTKLFEELDKLGK